ncbi:Tetratricopeptide repeat-containing protein [Albimonas donghaensis]|uniref:Tetratricopeptide repeat-containing protein n=1 Tax=Albimonas donghaensis TaxID=356660 RepID=A0A1H3E4N3_9RHOB|nr:tetratricopeptide repeat protein [Albimonas donghaensis]SDX73641.1 Tetratricopeptide repeat-containing protein [Albimonas donghaensis]
MPHPPFPSTRRTPRAHPLRRALAIALAAPLLLAGCTEFIDAGVDVEEQRAENYNPLDQDSLNEIMLAVAGPDEAVTYFREALASDPENPIMRRGLARSLSRAGRHAEARLVYAELVESPSVRPSDRVEYGLSLSRLDMWPEAEAQLALMPPGSPSDRKLTLMGLIADHRRDWDAADAAYSQARAMSPQPGSVLNNWGVSYLSRGESAAAEKMFEQALVLDPSLFSAKNNLAIAGALQGSYRLPLVTLTGEEKAVLYHNMAIIALRRGDRRVATGLLEQSLAAHPAHYAPAADKLALLRGG